MERLIDANKLKADFIGKRYGVQAIEYVIDQQPTVDAKPVVRCRDCEYIESKNTWYCWRRQNIVNADDFCSWGEKRETEQR